MRQNRIFTLSATVLALCSLAPVIKADATADATKAIQAAYDKSDSAMGRKDPKPLIAMHASDYESVAKNGKKSGLDSLKKSVAQIALSAKSIKTSTKVLKLALKGNEAVVTVKEHADIFLVNPQQPSQTAKIVADETAEHTWVKSPKGWLLKRSKTLTHKGSVNGQPLPDN